MLVWHWRAWSAERERICDCGIAYGKSAQDAVGIALAAAGGPYRHKIEIIEVVPVAEGESPSIEKIRDFRLMEYIFPLRNRSIGL